MATGCVSGYQTSRSCPQDQHFRDIRPCPRQNSAASPCSLRESRAIFPGARQKVVRKHAGWRPASYCIGQTWTLYKWLHVKTPQRGGRCRCHPLLGVGGDWVEPSDRRCPEERHVWTAPCSQKAHALHHFTLLEKQVGNLHTSTGDYSELRTFFFGSKRLLIIYYQIYQNAANTQRFLSFIFYRLHFLTIYMGKQSVTYW